MLFHLCCAQLSLPAPLSCTCSLSLLGSLSLSLLCSLSLSVDASALSFPHTARPPLLLRLPPPLRHSPSAPRRQGPGTDPATVQCIRDAIRTGSEVTVRLLNYKRSGTPFWNMFTLAPMKDSDDTIRFLVGVQVRTWAVHPCIRSCIHAFTLHSSQLVWGCSAHAACRSVCCIVIFAAGAGALAHRQRRRLLLIARSSQHAGLASACMPARIRLACNPLSPLALPTPAAASTLNRLRPGRCDGAGRRRRHQGAGVDQDRQ